MKKKFKNLINQFDLKIFKRLFCATILTIVALLSFKGIGVALSRYESKADIAVEPTMALFITNVGTETKTLSLGNMIPSDEKYYFAFTVSNTTEDGKQADIDYQYTMEITTTTNMKLSYKLYKESTSTANVLTSTYIEKDTASGVYYNHLEQDNTPIIMYYNKPTTKKYILEVEFPEEYKDFPDTYQGLVELVSVKVTSKQIVEGD